MRDSCRSSSGQITFFNDCDELHYCKAAISPDGRTGTFEEPPTCPFQPCFNLNAIL
jgi:hypothetical protein